MRGGASVIVTGVLMTVDPDCSVAISSLSEGECSPTTTAAAATSTDPIIAGAVVAIAIALIIAFTVAVIVFLVLKNCRGKLLLKKSNAQ